MLQHWNSRLFILIAIAFATILPVTVLASSVATPPETRPHLLPLSQVEHLEMPAVDRQAAAAEDIRRKEDGEPFRFAIPHQVNLTPEKDGTWEMLPNTDRLWRILLSCPDVLSLNLGFVDMKLPAGAVLRIYASDGSGPAFVFTDRDNRIDGQLWTPVLLTDELVIELQIPARTEEDLELRLGSIGCGYRFFGEGHSDKSGACNVDVICPEGNPWRDEIATVGVYTVDGTWTCSGAMINNTSQDERPLFLTADHCDVYASLAATVVVYWNFESPECGQHGGGSLDQFTSGSTLLATWSTTDFTLLELSESPDPALGVNFAGWDRSFVVPNSGVGIHHPSVDEKSISFEDDPLTVTSYTGDVSPGNGTHLRVGDWDLGTTEGGSSGSPLFNSSKLIVGQLHGGYASCTNNLPDWYGRFSLSWEGGGTDDTRLRTWLDPGGLGNVTLSLLDPDDGPIIEPPGDSANIRITSLSPNPFIEELTFGLEMDRSATVTVKVYNLAGRLVADLGNGALPQGVSELRWNGFAPGGARVPAGVYVLAVEAEGQTVKQSFVRLN